MLVGSTGRIVLPEGEDERILLAAVALRDASVHSVLLGAPAAIRSTAARLGVSLDGIELRDPSATSDTQTLIDAYCAARPNVKAAVARRRASKPLFHAGLLVKTGHAAAMVAGATCATGRVIEAALLTIGLAPDVATPSSCFLMCIGAREDQVARTLLFADCALNVEPSAAELADIGAASARSLRELTGMEPRIAFLSFSTHGSAQHPLVTKVKEAVALSRSRNPHLAIDGELQADAALSERTASLKVRSSSSVAGQANVLVFPDLNSANIGYKLVQYLGGAQALGPFLQGFARPVSDLSRGATVDDIVQTAILTLARSLPN